MGGGAWSTAGYNASTASKIAAGTTFGYDRYARGAGIAKPHESLDPRITAKNGMIESRDSDEHPNSVPIVIGVDQTGSMGLVPRVFQEKLAGVMDLLALRGYIEDPQIAVSAYGDCYADPIRTAVQFSNFESDNRVDDALDNLMLYGGGGGNGGETMTGIWYMMDKVVSDAWEKRGKKGYAFLVADEIALDLQPEHVKEFAGDGEPLAPLKVKKLAAHIQEKWEVYILLIDNMSARMQRSEKFYTNLFGKDHVLVLEDAEAVAETVVGVIGVSEGTVGLDDVESDLKSTGSADVAIRTATTALRKAGIAGDGTAVLVGAGANLPDDDGVERV